MTLPQQSNGTGDEAANVLAPEVSLFTDNDPALLGRALSAAARAGIRSPLAATSLTFRLGERLWNAGTAAVSRMAGRPADGPIQVNPKDKRFTDPAWEENPAFWALRQAYLAWGEYGSDLLRLADLDPVQEGKAELAWSFMHDAVAPTNFPATNPAVVKRALDTGGRSMVDGWRNFLDDMLHNNGRPRQVDTSPFEVGRNLACTPGKVVYRSDLIEVLQYEPQTEQVHEVPLLCSPPWINKYYVMDLAPQRSFIEWAVQHGRTVFAISYRNPDESMSKTSMDDYLVKGPRAAMDVISDITGAEKIDFVGLCLGGALTMMTATYLDEVGDDRLGSITLLNTMIDYSDPGALSRFTDEETSHQTRTEDAPPRLPRRQRHGGHLRHVAGQRPDLQLRGLQLADGQAAAGIRHPGLEQRRHPDARRDALVLPAQLLRAEQLHQGQADRAGRDARPQRRRPGPLRGGRDQRPHRALDGVLRDAQARAQ
jgi:polyhydroxyalkanoate synthase